MSEAHSHSDHERPVYRSRTGEAITSVTLPNGETATRFQLVTEDVEFGDSTETIGWVITDFGEREAVLKRPDTWDRMTVHYERLTSDRFDLQTVPTGEPIFGY